jgi:molybdopterin-synthase adenylyltransferase
MMASDDAQTFHSLPVQLIHIKGGVILKRGCTEIQIQGESIGQTLEQIFSLSSEKGLTKNALLASFPLASQIPISQLIDQLIERHLLVPHSFVGRPTEIAEDPTDIFYWHFGEPQADISQRLNAQKITIFGVNYISRQLVRSLSEAGFTHVEIVDEPGLRNLRLFDKTFSVRSNLWSDLLPIPMDQKQWEATTDPAGLNCLIATSDFGTAPILREWNQYAIEHNLRFFPIVLSNMIGTVGPVVIPNETACWECVLARQNSHLRDPGSKQAVDAVSAVSYEGQGIVGFHPSMASILGDIAAMEITKFFSRIVPLWNVGKLIEVNLLSARMITRKVLKLPRCIVCSPLNTRSAITPDKQYAHFSFSRAQE